MPTITEGCPHNSIVKPIWEPIDQETFNKALLGAAKMAKNPAAVQGTFMKMLG